MKRFTINASTALAFGLGLTLFLLWLLSKLSTGLPAARAADLTVCPAGPPTCSYASIQDAVDDASPGDVIKVAAGTYTGVQGRPAPPGYDGPSVITQVVYISKSVTIRGGYTTTNWTTPDPAANPTTLDAQGQGRVIYITGNISPTIEGLRITGGDAAWLGGGRPFGDAGGGAYVITATATISNNQVFSNTAEDGGGLFLHHSNNATLSANTVTSNTADSGGGLFLNMSHHATLSANTITSNTAYRSGGGLFLYVSYYATLSANAITSNTANSGGGLSLSDSGNATLNNNLVADNRANFGGGGLSLGVSDDATLISNTITSNTASDGGGLFLFSSFYAQR